jgi:predicted nucleic acid-binding Zn ribbon protein
MSMQPLATVLQGLLRELGLEGGAAGWRAVSEWPALAGDHIARHSRATDFRDGILTVEVEGSAWMHELSFQKLELVRRVNQSLGADIVRELRFVLARGGILR